LKERALGSTAWCLRLTKGAFVIPSRTAIEKQFTFRFICPKLRAGPLDQLQRATAALAAQAGVDTRKLLLDLCLGWDEVQLLAREPDVSIGAHSISHPILAKCDLTTAMREIAENKIILEGRLGKPVRHLAYPFGDVSSVGAREFQLAGQAGYITAITSQPGHIFYKHAIDL
jgi:peptidoglycan/xylan/chitin deacetylase (PgdA/CDA1 family)